MGSNRSVDMGTTDLRLALAEVLNEVAIRGRITYVTSRGRRVAAIVPVAIAEAAEAADHDDSPRSSE